MPTFFENLKNSEPFKIYNSVTSVDVPSGESGNESKKSNPLLFKDAKEGEKTGLQKITLLDNKGKERNFFLIVPERESVGYGEIRGWGGSKDSSDNGTARNMPWTRSMWDWAIKASPNNKTSNEVAQGSAAIASPLSAAADVLIGNTLMNNATKNVNSEYTGEDKAVGFGSEGQSLGRIMGMIDDNNEQLNAEETKYFLKNLKKNGFVALKDYEKPTKVQEHTGPAYVPGDILLGFLGLQPNRGSVGYKFKDYDNNEDYKSFVSNLRESKKRNK